MDNNDIGILYIVPTPIGNLKDISKRSINILSTVDFILCEDTRKTIKLLNKFNIKNKLISYYKEIENKESENAINLLLKGNNLALVSDSGTPLISDPGSILIEKCLKHSVNIISLPGPSAFLTALVASGFDLSEFTFYGFSKNIKKDLNKIKLSSAVSVIYESPHRIIKTLHLIQDLMPNRNLCLAKEISKINENYYRGKASDLLQMNILTKGEFVLILDKASVPLNLKDFDISLTNHLSYYVNQGLSKKEAIKRIATDLEVSKNEIYKKFSND